MWKVGLHIQFFRQFSPKTNKPWIYIYIYIFCLFLEILRVWSDFVWLVGWLILFMCLFLHLLISFDFGFWLVVLAQHRRRGEGGGGEGVIESKQRKWLCHTASLSNLSHLQSSGHGIPSVYSRSHSAHKGIRPLSQHTVRHFPLGEPCSIGFGSLLSSAADFFAQQTPEPHFPALIPWHQNTAFLKRKPIHWIKSKNTFNKTTCVELSPRGAILELLEMVPVQIARSRRSHIFWKMSSNSSKALSTNESSLAKNIMKMLKFVFSEARNEYMLQTPKTSTLTMKSSRR